MSADCFHCGGHRETTERTQGVWTTCDYCETDWWCIAVEEDELGETITWGCSGGCNDGWPCDTGCDDPSDQDHWCGVHGCDDPTCARDVVFDERRREGRHVDTVKAVVGL